MNKRIKKKKEKEEALTEYIYELDRVINLEPIYSGKECDREELKSIHEEYEKRLKACRY